MSARSPAVPLLVLLPALIACSAGPDGPPAAARAPAAGGAPAAAGAAPTEAWGCDEPQPGHPTAAEQAAFVDEVARLATAAEQRHGVPAAALVAMAILESGYGWTRLGLETNNLLAWHYVSGPAAGGRDYWVLDCPSEGADARFVVFADRAEAVDFVARQLATSDNYRADTERYRRDRAGGADVVAAVDRWVAGVADPYSSRPEEWARAVRRLMNDPYAPTDRRSPERNLYRLSGLTAPSPS